jgi:hypothetical protein
MKIINFNKAILIIIGFLFSTLSFSQNERTYQTSRLLTLKFSNYSVETDKQIQAEFNKVGNYQSVYTCIPAGIVVIESKNEVTTTEKQEVEKKIASINDKIMYEVLIGLSVNQAEEKCNTKRIIEN